MENCSGCIQAKKLLNSLGVKYTEKYVDADESAMVELAKLGSRSLPTILVDDHMIMGFNEKEIRNAMKK